MTTFEVVQANSMQKWPVEDGSVSMVCCSPPYALSKAYSGGTDIVRTDYEPFTLGWLEQAYRALKPDGRIAINVPFDTSKDHEQYPLCYIVQKSLEAVGFRYFTIIPWAEGTVGKRTSWGSWLRASAPYVTCSSEAILIYTKGRKWKLDEDSLGESGIDRQDFIDWTLSPWHISGQNGKAVGHPAAFPVELPRRLMLLFSNRGGLICDPFSGSGSTGVAAIRTGRNFKGLDISHEYVAASYKRLTEEALKGAFTTVEAPVPV